jgi:hypothetical protein
VSGTGGGLVGTWRLRSWEAVSATEGEPAARPMGDDPEGLLVYTDEGTMLVLIGRPRRERFASDDLLDATLDERSAAIETFIAYGGSYTVDGETVAHRVEMSLFPNWVGTIQERNVELDPSGEVLTLTSGVIRVRGSERRQRLVWERVRR